MYLRGMSTKSHDPEDKGVAKGMYIICSHQSEVKFPRMIVGHCVPQFGVRHCNSFAPHYRLVVRRVRIDFSTEENVNLDEPNQERANSERQS